MFLTTVFNQVMRIERGREEIEYSGKPMKTCKSEVTGKTTEYFYKDWRGRVPPKASDRAIKARKKGHKEGDHLQAWACTFSQQGDMLAVTTSGIVVRLFVVFSLLDTSFSLHVHQTKTASYLIVLSFCI